MRKKSEIMDRVRIKKLRLRGCLDAKISSLNFRHSISITHHSSLNFSHSFGTIAHFSLLNIFHTICGPYTCHSVQLFFFPST